MIRHRAWALAAAASITSVFCTLPQAHAQTHLPGELFTGTRPEIPTTQTHTPPAHTEPALPALFAPDTAPPASAPATAPTVPTPATEPAPPATVPAISAKPAPATEPAPPVSKPPAPPPPAVVKKVAVPTGQVLTDANRLVSDVYKDEIEAAKTPAQKSVLALKMFDAARIEKDLPAQFALLSQVKALAQESGDIDVAFAALDAVDKAFGIDLLKMRAVTLPVAARNLRTADQRKSLIVLTRHNVDEAVLADRYDVARVLADSCLGAARAGIDPATAKDAFAISQALREIETAFADLKPAFETLAAKPADPAANFKIGKFRCYYQGNWKAGLPLLVQGTDATLAILAQKDIDGPTAADEQVKLADGWWDLIPPGTSVTKTNLQLHAAALYNAALPQLSGLVRIKVEKRLREVEIPSASQPGKLDEQGFLGRILLQIPKELLPAEKDGMAEAQAKTMKIRAWLAGSGLVPGGGTSVSIPCRCVGLSVNSFTPPAPPGQPGSPSATQAAPRLHMNYRFQDKFDLKGTPCVLNLTYNRNAPNFDDPDLQRLRAIEREGAEAAFLVTTTVSFLSISVGFTNLTYDANTKTSIPASPSTLLINFGNPNDEFSVRALPPPPPPR